MRFYSTTPATAWTLCAILSPVVHAVSLADMAPRASNLPSACNTIYDAQIPGCTPQDFISAHCSLACIHSLETLVGPIERACGHQGVTGQNLIVAYLEGEGPQQLCHNAPPNSGMGPPAGKSWGAWPTQKPTTAPIASFTSTAQPITSTPSSLLIDTSSLHATHSGSASFPGSSQTAPTTTSTTSHHYNKPIAPASLPTSSRSTLTPVATTSGPAGYQTNAGDGSGGGSPFDSAGNLASAASPSVASSISLVTILLAAGMALMTSLS